MLCAFIVFTALRALRWMETPLYLFETTGVLVEIMFAI